MSESWATYETWLVAVWLDNDRNNYEIIQRMSMEDIVQLNVDELKQKFYYGDSIAWSNVNVDEIIEKLIQDMHE